MRYDHPHFSQAAFLVLILIPSFSESFETLVQYVLLKLIIKKLHDEKTKVLLSKTNTPELNLPVV